MKETVESWIQQGNTCFLAGKHDDAILCYYNALKKSGVQSIVKYAQKNKDNLSENQEMLPGITLHEISYSSCSRSLTGPPHQCKKSDRRTGDYQSISTVQETHSLKTTNNTGTIRRCVPRSFRRCTIYGDGIFIKNVT
jgi:hypothetical protein